VSIETEIAFSINSLANSYEYYFGKRKKEVSFKPEVKTSSIEDWAGNACRFATRKEAEEYVFDLSMRWTSVREFRVVESDDPVSCDWTLAGVKFRR
jgi:hypothetical protein